MLPGAIDSVLSQTYPDLELIVVDDCSNDETPSVLKAYEARDPRVRVVGNKTNLKLPASLNVGFRQAQGRFLTWTSDDNWYEPLAIEMMVKKLEAEPSVGLVYTDMLITDECGETIKYLEAGPPEELIPHNVVGACFLYRREVMDAIGDYDEELYLAEDFEYWIRAEAQFRFDTIHEPLYRYRYHPRSLTSTFSENARAQAALKGILKNLDQTYWLKGQRRDQIMRTALAFSYWSGDLHGIRHFLPYVATHNPWHVLRAQKSAVVALIKGESWLQHRIAESQHLRAGLPF